MDESHALYQLGKAHRAFDKSLATDQEWQEHFDQVAPVVTSVAQNVWVTSTNTSQAQAQE